MRNILVLNPNSSASVTARMQQGCEAIELHPDHRVAFHTLAGGPPGIETQRHVECVVIPTCDYLLANPADAYVIGCFSDPGLHLAREELGAPVFGIGESAYLTAAERGDRFGIVSIKAGSIARHHRAVRALGLLDRLAGDRALDLGVTELLDEERAVERIVGVGRRLRDEDGADVLVLGCATMGCYRSTIETILGIAVVDPTQAAVLRASSRLSAGATPS